MPPCTTAGKREFLEWFENVSMLDNTDWIVFGDFNIMRKPEDRNREGADLNEIFLFNQAINKLDLIELPLHGRQFTWTNMRFPPLLERLDWFFTSISWTTKYPDSIVKTLCMEYLIIGHVLLRLQHLFQSLTFLDLRITGYIMMISSILLCKVGMPPPTSMTRLG